MAAAVKANAQNSVQAQKTDLRAATSHLPNQQTGKKTAPALSNSDNSGYVAPEETPEMEEGLLANCENPKGLIERIKSWFNNSPKFGHSAKFTDLEIGDGIVARVLSEENLAKQVLIIKVPTIRNVRGEVTGVDTAAQTMTIQPAAGEAVTVNWDDNTIFILKGLTAVADAKYATAVYDSSTGTAQDSQSIPDGPGCAVSDYSCANTDENSD